MSPRGEGNEPRALTCVVVAMRFLRLPVASFALAIGLVACAAPERDSGWPLDRQRRDGSWEATEAVAFDVGVTSLVMLLLQGAASHGEARERGTHWLLVQQDRSTGAIAEDHRTVDLTQHAIATAALSDGLFLRGHDDHRAVRSAVEYLEGAVGPEGAWKEGPDAVLTGWVLYALLSARAAQVSVDEQVIARGRCWIDAYARPCQREDEGIATAPSLLLQRVDPEGRDGGGAELRAQWLVAHPPALGIEGFRSDPLYWFFGTLAMYQTGGRSWKRWNEALKPILRAYDGMSRPVTSTDPGMWAVWEPGADPLAREVLRMLTLEVYFRYGICFGMR